MGKISLETLTLLLNSFTGENSNKLSTTLPRKEIEAEFEDSIKRSTEKTFVADFMRSYSIGEHTKLSKSFISLDASSNDDVDKMLVEISKQLRSIGCSDSDQQALALLATQHRKAGMQLGITSLISGGLLEPWNINSSVISQYINHSTNLYNKANVIQSQQIYTLDAIHDVDKGFDSNDQLIKLDSALVFTTRCALTHDDKSFTYSIVEEDIQIPNTLRKVLTKKFENVFKTFSNQITDQQLISLIAFAEIDTDLRDSIAIYIRKYTNSEFFKKIETISPQFSVQLAQLYEDPTFKHMLIFEDGILNKEFVRYVKELIEKREAVPDSSSIEELMKKALPHIEAVLKQPATKITEESLDNLVVLAETNHFVRISINSVIKQHTNLDFFKKLKIVKPEWAQELCEDETYKTKLVLQNCKLDKEFFIHLNNAVQKAKPETELLLQEALTKITTFVNKNATLRIVLSKKLKEITELSFFEKIHVASPALAHYLFLDEKYRRKLLLKNGSLNEDFFTYLKKLTQDPEGNKKSLGFAANLCEQIIQDKKLIPKLIAANKFGDTLYDAPGTLANLENATLANILGEITKRSGLLINECLANSKLRRHFQEKRPNQNDVITSLEDDQKHTGLIAHVLLEDRKQRKPNSVSPGVYEAVAALDPTKTKIAAIINSPTNIMTAAKKDRYLAIKLLKTFPIASAQKAEIMLNYVNSKKIAKQIFRPYSWPKRWFVTSPCYKLNTEDLLLCYVRSPQARKIIQQDHKLLRKSVSDIQSVKKVIKALTNEEIIELYANHSYFRELTKTDPHLNKCFTACYNSDLGKKLGNENKHIAALYLLYPALRLVILRNSYLASRLYNNTDADIVSGLLETQEFNDVSNEIKTEMTERVAKKQSNLNPSAHLSSDAEDILIEESDAANDARKNNTNEIVEEPEIINPIEPVLDWKQSLQGLNINKDVLNTVCSLGMFSGNLKAKTAETILQTQAIRPSIAA